MKLASPRTVQTNISEERRADIDNGVKIARKVDTLQETLSELEKKHSLFIEGSVKELKKRTEKLTQKIIEKEREILRLEQVRAKLLEPLDARWQEVEEKDRELETESNALAEMRHSLTLLQGDLTKREEKVLLEEKRIADIRVEISLQTERITNTSLEAQNTLLNARNEEERVLGELKKKQFLNSSREKELSNREDSLNLKEENLKVREQNIIKEKLQLANMRGTLERAIKKYGGIT